MINFFKNESLLRRSCTPEAGVQPFERFRVNQFFIFNFYF